MSAQAAIEKVLQEFTKELLKVFSEAVLQAVTQVGDAGRAALPAASEAAIEATRTAARKATAKVVKAAAKAPAKSAKVAAKPARAGRAGAVVKSTPEEVAKLGERIVEALRKASRNLASKELMQAAGLRTTDEGRFQYALNKLKEDGAVQQHGERRQARYGLGGKAKSTRKPRSPVAAVADVEREAAEPAAAEG